VFDVDDMVCCGSKVSMEGSVNGLWITIGEPKEDMVLVGRREVKRER
jgi:hypothetical protein